MAEITFDAISTADVQLSSCTECKARKLKCTRRLPCDVCAHRGFECIYLHKSSMGKRLHKQTATRKRQAQSPVRDGPDARRSTRPPLQPFRHTDKCGTENSSSLSSTPISASTTMTTSVYSPDAVTPLSLHELPFTWDSYIYPSCQFLSATSAPDLTEGNNLNLLSGTSFYSTETHFMSQAQLQDPSLSPQGLGSLPLQTVAFDNISVTYESQLLQPILSEQSATTFLNQHIGVPSVLGNIDVGFWPDRIPHRLVVSITNLYLRQIHPSIPLFKAADLTNGVASGRYQSDRQFAAMVLGLCTFTLLQPQEPNTSLLSSETPTVLDFLRECASLQSVTNLGENATVETLLTSIYLFGAFDALGQRNAAWLKLQELITISEILDFHDLEQQHMMDEVEWEKRARLCLCLTIIDRAYVAGRWRRLPVPEASSALLGRFTELSVRGDHVEGKNISAIRLLVEAFGCVEDDLRPCWNNHCSVSKEKKTCNRFTSERLLSLIRKVPRSNHKDWVFIVGAQASVDQSCTAKARNEQGDVLLTCLWVLNRLWHLGLTHNHVSDDNPNFELRPSFAISIAQVALLVLKKFTISGLELHGQGLAEKIYDIGVDFIHMTSYVKGQLSQSAMLADFGPFLSPRELHITEPPLVSSSFMPSMQDIAAPMSISCIKNAFLGFFALFDNGRDTYLSSFISLCQRSF